ncbi:MAG: PRC-barrel domain-containing protein [Armatimonadota bacterium]
MTRGSYLLIEPGMTVQGIDGDAIGTVTELVADEGADIFRGIVLNLRSARSASEVVFMPGEHITAVEAQSVFTDMNQDSAAHLEAVNAGAERTDGLGA